MRSIRVWHPVIVVFLYIQDGIPRLTDGYTSQVAENQKKGDFIADSGKPDPYAIQRVAK
jgi:hypothetical protein